MGKILEALEGVSLPPEVASKIRVLDLQHAALEKKLAVLEQEADTLRMVDHNNAYPLPQSPGADEVARYTTQKITDQNDPTEDELPVLQLFQPRQRIAASAVAMALGIDLMKATAQLNELQQKRYLSHDFRTAGFRRPAPEPRYYLTDTGIHYLANH